LLQREHTAYALFADEWASTASATASAAAEAHRAAARRHRALAGSLATTLNERLWRRDLGYHMAWNVSSRTPILSRTYVIALPLWAGLVNGSQAAAIAETLAKPDMLSSVGIRSTSSDDPRYSNANEIVPCVTLFVRTANANL
jgi:glycogen debranching enzyme